MKLRAIPATVLTTFIAACGGNSASDAPYIEDFAEVPELPASATFSWELAEQEYPPGGDRQICHYLEPTTEDLWVKAFDSFQGRYGHHLILFKARITEPPGTIRDCTSAEDMIRLSPIVANIQFGLERFPEGMAIRVPAGTQLVLQQHYVNTSEKPIRVRDVAYMETVPRDEVEIPAGFFGVSDINFELPADPENIQRIAFECEVPNDMKLLLAGPHMHEWGTEFVAEMGPAGALQEVIRVEEWEAWMRDEPPVTNWSKEAPFELKAGDVMRTTCNFRNTTNKPLIFPEEMCATYGYYFPAPEGNGEFTCAGRRID